MRGSQSDGSAMGAQLNDHKHARRARITRFEIARDTSWLPASPVAHITWNYATWLDLVALVIASRRDSSFRGIRAGHSHLTNANTSPSPNSSINPIIAAMYVRVNVTWENPTVHHQHIIAEHEHPAVHRRGIRDPARPRTFATHRVGEIHGRLH